MRVTVLCGGPSAEREVSLRSGKCVARALEQAGHTVFVSDVSPTDLAGLDTPADVIFPVLHGDFGESGELQEILEARGLPFVGSGSVASRLGMDKIEAKKVWLKHGLRTPRFKICREIPTNPAELGLPVVAKAISSGSSIDVHLCKTKADVREAAKQLLARHDRFMLEEFATGVELTIGLLDGAALPPIRIATKNAFYDFQAKYNTGTEAHHFDTGLPADVLKRCADLAVAASDTLGCRDVGRVDLIVDDQGWPTLLEINTLPGFTDVSLLPDAARQAGIAFPQLVDKLVKLAAARASYPSPSGGGRVGAGAGSVVRQASAF